VTAELALLFGRALGQSPEYWLNLQTAYDLRRAESAIGRRLDAVDLHCLQTDRNSKVS
jgi:plasmid maintenance system antidote protein VapI